MEQMGYKVKDLAWEMLKYVEISYKLKNGKIRNTIAERGYILEKLKSEDPIIQELLDYRQLMKLNSTYVEGLKPYINPKDKRIHSFFHQTITATGRISSTEPNLQNIPT